MTTLGKILVIVNLVFSLLTGALIVMVYATRTNWHAEYVKRVDEVKAAQSTVQTLRTELEQERTAHGGDVKKLQDTVADLNKRLEGAQNDTQLRVVEVGTAQKQALAQQGASSTAAEEVKQLRGEVVKLQEDVAKRDKRMFGYEQEVKELRDKAVSAEIAYKSELERTRQLLDQVSQLSRENQRLGTPGRGAAPAAPGGVTTSSLKPPPEDVQGTVVESDPRSGLVTINIGSDKGVNKGHTLEVYRTSPEAKYLGKLQIVDARPHEAVGRLTSSRAVIQKGDIVAASILPRR